MNRLMCPKFGHNLDIFWMHPLLASPTKSGQRLDMFWTFFWVFGHIICSHQKLSKMWQHFGLFFGHVLQDWTYFGHILDILEGLDMFWIHCGHFLGD